MSTPVKPEYSGATAATPDTGKPPPAPSLAEAYFFLNIIKYVRGKLDVDWSMVAQESGFKNAETAKVRFGQVKKKLGFNNSTPAGARVKPGGGGNKRGANDDGDSSAAPAAKKPRKTPAKPRGKKAQAPQAQKTPDPAAAPAPSTPVTATSTTALGEGSDEESPLAAKSKVLYQNNNSSSQYAYTGGNIPGGDGGYVNPYDYNPEAIAARQQQEQQGYAKAEPGLGSTTGVKLEPSDHEDSSSEDEDDDDDEAEQNARHKAELMKQIRADPDAQTSTQTQTQIHRQGHAQGSYDTNNNQHPQRSSPFGPQLTTANNGNNFPVVNMMSPAPTTHQQYQNQQRHPLPTTSNRQIREAAAREAMAAAHAQQIQQAQAQAEAHVQALAASTASLRQNPTHTRHGGATAQQPAAAPAARQKTAEVDEAAMATQYAFNAAMYGAELDDDDDANGIGGGMFRGGWQM